MVPKYIAVFTSEIGPPADYSQFDEYFFFILVQQRGGDFWN